MYSQPRHKLQAGGQIQAPAGLFAEKQPRYSRLSGPRAGLDDKEEGNFWLQLQPVGRAARRKKNLALARTRLRPVGSTARRKRNFTPARTRTLSSGPYRTEKEKFRPCQNLNSDQWAKHLINMLQLHCNLTEDKMLSER
jgi:hypothetical protein